MAAKDGARERDLAMDMQCVVLVCMRWGRDARICNYGA